MTDDARMKGALPCLGIEPVNGWQLVYIEDSEDRMIWREYFARSGEADVHVDVSRFSFEPTQERFDWLVANGFCRPAGMIGPLNSDDIDAMIELETQGANT